MQIRTASQENPRLRAKSKRVYQPVWWPLQQGGWLRCEMWLTHLSYGEKYSRPGWEIAADVWWYDPKRYAPTYFLLDLLYSEVKAEFDYAEHKAMEHGGKIGDPETYADAMY